MILPGSAANLTVDSTQATKLAGLRRRGMIQINAQVAAYGQKLAMWQTIASVPLDRDLEIAVINKGDVHALAFPCRRVSDGWINAITHARIEVHPTHWREWSAQRGPLGFH